jgi:hypothetical protein
MGMLGIVLSVCIIALGAGYAYFGERGSSIVIENRNANPSLAEDVAAAESLIGQARDLKSTLEEQAEARMEGGEPSPAASPPALPEEAKADPSAGGKEKEGDIVDRKMSSGYSVPSKPRNIDTIVIHSSYDALGNDP